MSNADPLRSKVYKRCESCCMKCRQCREFEMLIDQIDLEERSQIDRQRIIDKERSRDA